MVTYVINIIMLFALTTQAKESEKPSWEILYDYVSQAIVGLYKPEEEKSISDSASLRDQRTIYCEKFKPFFKDKISVLDLKTLEALEVIQSHNDIALGAFRAIPTQTQGGLVYKNAMLAFPSVDVTDAKKSQIIVKTLVNDISLREKVKTCINRLQQAESILLNFFDTKKYENLSKPMELSELYPERRIYFTWNPLTFLNTKPWAMQASYTLFNVLPTITGLLGIATGIGIGTEKAQALSRYSSAYQQNNNSEYYKTIAMGAGIGLLSSLPMVYPMYQDAKRLHNRILQVNEILNHIGEYITVIRELDEVIQQNTALHDNLLYSDFIHTFASKQNISEELRILLQQLETDTFKGTPSFFSYRGRILVAQYLLEKQIDEFVSILFALSEIDTLTALAQLYSDCIDKTAQYCYAHLIDQSEKPLIKAVDFWNVQLNADEAITNSIEMGDTTANNVVVTGINRGGKSTIFKSLALNSIMAQVFGIAAARTWEQTPFTAISCYLDVVQDIQKRTSAFQAELERAQEIYDAMRGLKPKTFAVLLIDEMFTATEPTAGSLVSRSFAKKLAGLPSVLTVFISHYKEVAQMAQTMPQLFKNYYVVAHENADGSFVPTYRIAEGISTQNDALLMAKEAGFVE